MSAAIFTVPMVTAYVEPINFQAGRQGGPWLFFLAVSLSGGFWGRGAVGRWRGCIYLQITTN